MSVKKRLVSPLTKHENTNPKTSILLSYFSYANQKYQKDTTPTRSPRLIYLSRVVCKNPSPLLFPLYQNITPSTTPKILTKNEDEECPIRTGGLLDIP